MSQEQEPMQDPDTPGAVPVEAEASSPAKPRARRPRAASPVVEPAPAGAEEALKPARKTTRRRKADDVVPAEAEVAATVAAEATAVDEAAVAEVVPKPAARSRRKAPAVVADAPLATAAEAATQDVVVAAADAGQSSDLADQKPVAAEASADANVEANADDHADVMAEPEPGVGPRRAAMAAQQAEEMVQVLLTGDFDREQEAEVVQESEAYKRVLRPEPDAPKLQKVLAQSGVGSRRDIEKMIEDGRIEVNDQVAHIGQRVSFGDRIKLDGKPIRARITPPPARILAYHKPVGEVVTRDDPEGRPTVFRNLPRLQHGKWMSVGRLDLNTEGLLLFTTSGELANQLMHPRFGVEREYAVRVLGTLDDASRQRLLDGVEIDGQTASFTSISNGLGEGVNQWYRVVIMEGRNREVRKLFDTVGLTVSRLIRVRYGAIVLPRGLRRGVWVELGESDVRAIKALVGVDRHEQGRGGKGKPGGKGAKPQDRQDRQERQAQGQGRGPQGGQGRGPQQGQPGQHKAGRPPVERERAAPRDEFDDDDIDNIGRIPNPLEQTFDRRFVKGSKRIVSGFGRPDHEGAAQRSAAGGKQKGPRQPDPMQTSVGYIGADAYFGGGGGRRGQGGGNSGGGGGSGGGGRRGRR